MVDKPTAKRARDEGGDTQGDPPAERVVNIDDFNNIITVLVGREEQQFILYQDVVCAKSKFFRAACSKKWREGQEKIVRLPEVQPDVFKAYCGWLYSGRCPEPLCTEDSDTAQQASEINRLIDLHLLGETLDDIQLRNRSITVLFQSMRNQNLVAHHSHVKLVWESTLPHSQLRKMLVHVIVSRLDDKIFAKSVTQYPPEFVQDIAVTFMTAQSMVLPWQKTAERLSQFQEVEKADSEKAG